MRRSLTRPDETRTPGSAGDLVAGSFGCRVGQTLPVIFERVASCASSLENPEPCVRRKSVPGSKFAAFWRIFVPGSNLPLGEIPTRSPTILIPPGVPPSKISPILAKIPSRCPP